MRAIIESAAGIYRNQKVIRTILLSQLQTVECITYCRVACWHSQENVAAYHLTSAVHAQQQKNS